MDDLVVIILTLVVAGIGILGQVKKKKQNQPVSGNEKNPENIWDVIQREMNPVAPVTQQELEEEDFYDDVEQVKTPTYEFEAQNEGKSVKEKSVMEEIPKRRFRKISNENFSLKKAIIYSEILNRKYT